jgi:UTP--glucose-1-phosphate uridylyltransferase
MKITKAIIPVAGWGTRRLPITKTIEKCMLPIGNRPLVDYVVQDCLAAGINELIFVVGEDSTQLQDYYRSNITLNDYLKKKGKTAELELVAPLKDVSLHFITQPSYGKYGSAVPVGLASEYIEEGESALVLMGDDFIWNEDGSSEAARLIEAASDDGAAMLGVNVPREEVSKYGVLKLSEAGEYESIVEKPNVDETPSTLINISKYLLPKHVIDACVDVAANPARGEYEITDVVNQFAQNGGRINVVEAKGRYLDGGSVEGWLQANNVVLG